MGKEARWRCRNRRRGGEDVGEYTHNADSRIMPSGREVLRAGRCFQGGRAA